MLLSIIIVNYNTQKLLAESLHSIYRYTRGLDFETLVVDNSSCVGSLAAIKKSFPAIIVVENKKNIGFAAANNQAIRHCLGDYILLLNPDTLVFPDTFKQMIDFMEHNASVGIVGAQLLDRNANPHPQPSCTGIFPSVAQALFEYTCLRRLFPKNRLVKDYFLTEWDHATTKEVAMVQGACLMIKRKVIDAIGLLDERFFMYWEDTDWCLRAKKKGWKIFYLPNARCVHLGAQSIDNKEQDYYNFFKSMYLFYKKYYGLAYAILLRFILLLSFIFQSLELSLKYILIRRNRERKKRDLKVIIKRIKANFMLF